MEQSSAEPGSRRDRKIKVGNGLGSKKSEINEKILLATYMWVTTRKLVLKDKMSLFVHVRLHEDGRSIELTSDVGTP